MTSFVVFWTLVSNHPTHAHEVKSKLLSELWETPSINEVFYQTLPFLEKQCLQCQLQCDARQCHETFLKCLVTFKDLGHILREDYRFWYGLWIGSK